MSILQLRPFSQNNTVHVIHEASAAPLTNSSKVDASNRSNIEAAAVMSLNKSKPHIPKLIINQGDSDFSMGHFHQESLTDTEQIPTKNKMIIIPGNKAKQGLKTSLYEIREEGIANASPNYTVIDPFKNTFSSKRFNRYPRFTIFLKKNTDGLYSNKYAVENTISLNPQFLTYLQETLPNGENPHESQLLHEEQLKEQGIIITTDKNKESTKIDPFEKVILVKGIDNSILTSFRTLKKQNNIVSDTLKVIHNKFQPFTNKHQTFLIMEKQQVGKMPYPLTDDEDTVQFTAAKILARNLRDEG